MPDSVYDEEVLVPPKWQYHRRPPSPVNALYHRNWSLLPICKFANQLNMLSALGYYPKSLFSAARRCHTEINFTQSWCLSTKSADDLLNVRTAVEKLPAVAYRCAAVPGNSRLFRRPVIDSARVHTRADFTTPFLDSPFNCVPHFASLGKSLLR